MQQGRYVGRLLKKRFAGKKTPKPFRYFDKGNMAVVGKGFAVLQSGKLHMSGFIAWLAWAAVHLEFLAQANLRVSVFLQWVWTYITGKRGSRLIIAPDKASRHRGIRASSDRQPESLDALIPGSLGVLSKNHVEVSDSSPARSTKPPRSSVTR